MVMSSCVQLEIYVFWSKGDGRVFCSQQVFVQRFSVSCHCGLQSTVVQSRVCHRSRGDQQLHKSLILDMCDVNSWYWISYVSRVFPDKELWW